MKEGRGAEDANARDELEDIETRTFRHVDQHD
jgi:hypothetical protein